MKSIYLASPFFNSEELGVYRTAIQRLRAKGYEVYVPQEHEVENGWAMTNYEWASHVFVEDIKAIADCDVVMVLNWGLYSDSGTAWEAGYAYGMEKDIVHVLCGECNTAYSLMMINGADKVVGFEDIGEWEEKASRINLAKIIQK